MKFFLWCSIGCACLGISFFIGYDQHDMWNSVFGGMIGGVVFMTALYFFVARKEFPSKWKIITASLFTFHIFAFAAFTLTSYRLPAFQRDELSEIGSSIMSGAIVYSEIYGRSWTSLNQYYNQPAAKKKSFVEVFHTLYGKTVYNGIFEIKDSLTSSGTFVMYQGDSVVHLVACNDTISNGLRPDFANINGRMGKIQYSATISKRGVKYERNN